jgi:integrase
MAKKQTRRSVSISKTTYERLKAYCETNALSMSEFVEMRIGDYLGRPAKKLARIVGEDDTAKKVADHIFTF